MLDDVDQNVGIGGTIVLLSLAKRSSFPVGHLFNFTNRFFEDFQGYFGKAGLLFDEVYFSEIALSIDEVLDIFNKVQVWKLPSELLDVGVKAESNDGGILIRKDF